MKSPIRFIKGLSRPVAALLLTLVVVASIGPGAEAKPPAKSPDLDLGVQVGTVPGKTFVGASLTVPVVAVNLGAEEAAGVEVTYQVPNGLEYVSAKAAAGQCVAKGNRVQCALGSVAAQGSVAIDFRLKVTDSGLITSTVSIDGDVADPSTANNKVAFQISVPEKIVPGCLGSKATIVGTSIAETLVGTAGRDVIVALGGDDQVRGKGGNDLICAGGGADIVQAGAGDDKVRGGAGRDRLLGRAGRDRLSGGAGADVLRGERGADVLIGGLKRDRCLGGASRDRFSGCERRRQ